VKHVLLFMLPLSLFVSSPSAASRSKSGRVVARSTSDPVEDTSSVVEVMLHGEPRLLSLVRCFYPSVLSIFARWLELTITDS
jgi:hypothetical protein